jgi:hypothetical protein
MNTPNIIVQPPKIYGYLATGVAVIIFLVIVYFIGKNIGKNTPPPEIKDPGTDFKSSFNPTALTDSLYNDIKGYSNPLNRNMDAWNAFLALSDTDFIKVLNDWDKRYFSKWQQTLYSAFKDEKFNPFTSANLITSLTKRFERIEALRK